MAARWNVVNAATNKYPLGFFNKQRDWKCPISEISNPNDKFWETFSVECVLSNDNNKVVVVKRPCTKYEYNMILMVLTSFYEPQNMNLKI